MIQLTTITTMSASALLLFVATTTLQNSNNVLVQGWTTKHAFSSPSRVITTKPHNKPQHQLLPPSRLQATIYAPPGTDATEFDDDDYDAEARFQALFGGSSSVVENNDDVDDAHIVDNLVTHIDFKSQEALAALARLACTFAHADSKSSIAGGADAVTAVAGPHLRDIESVEVLHLYDDHIEIVAVVCEEDGCVTVKVPVQFPKTCDGIVPVGSSGDNDSFNDMELCVLENLGALDVRAQNHIRELEWQEQHHEEFDARQREWNTLTHATTSSSEEQALKLPEWWIPPTDSALQQESHSIRRLLNEPDFQESVQALATQSIEQYEIEIEETKFPGKIAQAAVAVVGPAGLIVRASLVQEPSEQSWDNFDDDDDNRLERKIVEIPIPFATPQQSVEALRSAVLGLVAAASGEWS